MSQFGLLARLKVSLSRYSRQPIALQVISSSRQRADGFHSTRGGAPTRNSLFLARARARNFCCRAKKLARARARKRRAKSGHSHISSVSSNKLATIAKNIPARARRSSLPAASPAQLTVNSESTCANQSELHLSGCWFLRVLYSLDGSFVCLPRIAVERAIDFENEKIALGHDLSIYCPTS